MFGKKKKARELAAQELAAERVKTQQLFDENIQKASQIQDPAAKIIALDKIATNIRAEIWSEERAITTEADRKAKKIDSIGSTVTTAGGFAALTFIAGPVAWVGVPIIMAGGIGSGMLAKKRAKSLKEKFAAVSKDYLQNLRDLSTLVSEIKKVTVEENVQEISKSPLYRKVLEVPGITELYAAAAAKHIAVNKDEAAAKDGPAADQKATTPAEEKKPVPPPRKRQKPNYDELNGL